MVGRQIQTMVNRRRKPAASRRSWWIIPLAGAVAIGLSMLLLNSWRGTVQTPLPDVSTRPSPIAKLSVESQYLNTRPEATYLGSESCRDCHQDQFESYRQTAHSRSFSLVNPDDEPADGVFQHRLSNREMRAYREEGKLWHAEAAVLANGERLRLAKWPLKYLVGSGRFSRTYLAEVEGFLVESPITWYSSLEAWGMSPGYDKAEHLSFRRNVGNECLICHAGRTDAEVDSKRPLALHEMAIGCERCHGPGSIHAQLHKEQKTANGELDLSIVNPRRLPRELTESICSQCHLESVASTVVRGRRREDYRPGLLWTDFCVNYDYDKSSSEMTVTGHVEQMHRSRCYQASDSLTCTTCHHPHHVLQAEDRASYYRKVCWSCHANDACKLTADAREERNQNNCAACHMPQSPTDIPHIAFTHHRIGIHSTERQPAPGFSPRILVPVLDVAHLPAAEEARTRGLATLQLYLAHAEDKAFKPYLRHASNLLRSAADAGANDAQLAGGLAIAAVAAGDVATAMEQAARALREGDLTSAERGTMLGLMANIHFQHKEWQEARRFAEQATKRRLDPQDWFILALCDKQLGHPTDAIAAFEKVLTIDASQPATYLLLAELYRETGDAQRAERLVYQGRRLKELAE